MKKIIKEALPLERFTLPRNEAIEFMKEKEEPYKVELIEDLPEDAEISFYRQGDFTDLCAGPHMMNTKGVGKAFKLMNLVGLLRDLLMGMLRLLRRCIFLLILTIIMYILLWILKNSSQQSRMQEVLD